MSTLVLERYNTLEGDPIDLNEIERTYPGYLKWLRDEAKSAKSWLEFESRTARSCWLKTEEIWKGHVKQSSLMKLQADLAAQIGVSKGELAGVNTDSFTAFIK